MKHSYNNGLPKQTISRKKRSDKWWEENIEGGKNLAIGQGMNQKEIRDNMISNYRLWDNILDSEDIDRSLNPFNIRGKNFPSKPQHYPIGNQKLATLIGEEFNRNSPIRAFLINEEAISEKEESMKNKVVDRLTELSDPTKYPDLNKEQLKEKIEDLKDWIMYDVQDIREKFANSVIKFIKHYYDLKLIVNKGFKDILLSAGQIYKWDVIDGRIYFRKCERLSTYVYGMGDSYKVEDADIIVEEVYQGLGTIIDEYNKDLTKSQIRELEGKVAGETGSPEDPTADRGVSDVLGGKYIPTGSGGSVEAYYDDFSFDSTNAAFNDHGEVRVVRVTWKSKRKIRYYEYVEEGETKIEYLDEEEDNDENLGEIQEIWVNEWLEAVQIANEFIVKKRPCPIQYYLMDSYRIFPGSSGYVGTVMTTGTGKPVSMMDKIKPFNYLYDSIMMKLELLTARMTGPSIKIDVARIPDWMSFDDYLYYSNIMGIMVQDSAKEGDEETLAGKPIGYIPDTTGAPVNPDYRSFLQSYIELLTYLEQQMSTATGITRQREGNVHNRETAMGIERSVTQSTYNTEELYAVHEETIARVFEYGLFIHKRVFAEKKPQYLQYALEDGTIYTDTIDPDLFPMGDYGVVIGSNRDVEKLKSIIEEYAGNLLQSRQISFGNFMSVYNDPSNASVRRKMEKEEKKLLKQEQQRQEAEQELKKAELEDKAADREMEKYKADLGYKEAIDVQAMKEQDGKESVEEERMKSERTKEIEEKKLQAQERMKDKELAVQREKNNSDRKDKKKS